MGFRQSSELTLENNNRVDLGLINLFDHLPAYNRLIKIQDQHSALDLAEHYFRCGMEVLQQAGNDRCFAILNRSLLALIQAKKGEWDGALKIAEETLGEALTQGGVLAPICELLLSPIFLASSEPRQARSPLSSLAELYKKIDLETSLVKKGDAVLRTAIPNKLTQEDPAGKQGAVFPAENKDTYLFRIQMFGPIRVFHGGQELTAAQWRTVKSRHLLAYLAHQDKPVRTDQIIEDLWPYVDPDKALALFHTTLYYLRRLLNQFTNEEMIMRGSKRYQLRPGRILIDRFQFEEIAHSALEMEMSASLAEQLETAVLLYQGDYLEDLDYQWIMPVQEKLRNLNMELRQKLAVYYLQNKMPAKAMLHLQQLMALNPYSESTLKLLLTACMERGDQAAAIKHYVAFTKNISKELGLHPSSEMKRFFANILNQTNKAAF